MKKIILTGSTSALGTVLQRYTKEKYKFITVGRRESDINFDFSSDEELSFPEGNDVVVHMAAQTSAISPGEIEKLLKTNVQGTLKACMAAGQCGINHFILISSIYSILDESSPNYNYYSISKKHAEEVVLEYCKKNNINLCILRPAPIYGNYMFKKNQPLFYMMLDNAMNNRDINIWGKNDALRNYIYVENVINVLCGCIDNNISGIYDVISERNYKLSEIAETMIDECNSLSHINFLSEKDDVCDNSFFSSGEIYKILGINKTIDLKEGINRSIQMMER